jgi:hypothetical protein
MNNLTLISASYNTPDITEYMVKTFCNLYKETPILICENSTDEKTINFLNENKIPYIRNKNGLHAPSVDLLLNNITTDYALLVDTDILFLKDISYIFEQFVSNDITLMGEIVGDRGGKKLHKRVNPWHCFINVKHIKQYNIKFYDEYRLKSRNEIRYDVGSSFFEDIHKLKLKIADFNGQDIYYKHFEGMSWRVNKFKKHGIDGDIDNNINDTHNNIALYEYGMHIYDMYVKEIEKLKNLKINYNTK